MATPPGRRDQCRELVDQPAAGEPAQPPHAYLLGDDGDGLRCQVSGGAKAHGLRVITGLLGPWQASLQETRRSTLPT